VTTTRRGWWPALEPALLVLTVVVWGSLSLLASSNASLRDSGRHCDTPGSDQWTATGNFQDSIDDGLDDDGSDDDGLDDIRLERPSLYGPSHVGHADRAYSLDRNSSDYTSRAPAWTADDSLHRPRNSTDDSVDDDDDDDGLDKWAAAGNSHDSFDAVRLEHPSLRGPSHLGASDRTPSLDPNMFNHTSGVPAWTAGDSQSHRQNSTDDDIDDDDDDDDGLDKWAATGNSHDSFDVVRLEHPSLRGASHLSHSDRAHSLDRNIRDYTSGAPARTTTGRFQRPRQDSSDDNVDSDDDDDDDDDDSSELAGFSPTIDRGQTRILILSEFDALFSFASDNHSLRAPPQ